MKKYATCFVWMASLLFAATDAKAQVVAVEMHGTVEWNVFIDGPLEASLVHAGDPVVMSFEVDTNVFTNSGTFPVRGYPVIAGSFSLRIGEVDVELVDPTISDVVPYWVIRNNDPMADGVFFSTDIELPEAPPIDLPGATGAPFAMSFERGFSDGNQPNAVFNSLNIQDECGYWGFEWMSSYSFGVEGGGGSPLGVIYDWFSMTLIPEPVIIEQPEPLNVCVGEPVSFSVAATGVTTYQWRQNGIALADGVDATGATISGATMPVLTIDVAANDHVGQYDCVVTNGGAEVFSGAATLGVWASCVPGDMNCDFAMTAGDTPAFVQALLNPAGFAGCNVMNADINLDGIVDGSDIDPYVHLLVP